MRKLGLSMMREGRDRGEEKMRKEEGGEGGMMLGGPIESQM
jgi:hypothetical protein